MATNAFNSLQHHSHHLRRRHSIDYLPSSIATATNSFFSKPITTTTCLSHSATFTTTTHSTVSTTVSTTPTSTTICFDLLRHHLSSKNFRQADEETRRLLILLAGESPQKRGYVFFSEVQFIPVDDLKTIDDLWRQHSDSKFGYSVQKKIWEKSNKDFTKFFIKVGWMKKLEGCEVEQYNYRSFPTEFMWEMEEGTPEGHLPLTNALRGTQLLNSILSHPAFEEDEEEEEVKKGTIDNGSKAVVTKRTFKPNYTF